ncbi:MAG: cysteine hydrolase [Alphaproteobacteria bacterium]|nr:cysteine hydrolase [Alphaproteobacteria bacterium]
MPAPVVSRSTALLTHGPLTARTAHLCVDMQRMFLEDTPWHTPWMARVLPAVATLAAHRPSQTIFTRFLPPESAADVHGGWRRYYTRWDEMTGARIDPRLLALAPPLDELVPPATVWNKRVYSAFFDGTLAPELSRRHVDSLVVTGVETDVCVLATVLSAIDLGFRVVLVSDALGSASDTTHDALMTLYTERYAEQLEVAQTDTVLRCWL